MSTKSDYAAQSQAQIAANKVPPTRDMISASKSAYACSKGACSPNDHRAAADAHDKAAQTYGDTPRGQSHKNKADMHRKAAMTARIQRRK